jgi:hypothetical protein
VTYLIEYLGEFEYIFKTVLGYVSGDQMGSFEAKKKESKISRLGTFKGLSHEKGDGKNQLKILAPLAFNRDLSVYSTFSQMHFALII